MWGIWNLSDRAWPGPKVAGLSVGLRDLRWLVALLMVSVGVMVFVALASPSAEEVRRKSELDRRERTTGTCIDRTSCATDR